MSDGTFMLLVNGQIEYIDIITSSGSSWHCKYEFVFGTDWKIVKGLHAGMSQRVNVVSNDNKVTLNFPIEVTYKSTNPFGWPQIVLSVYRGASLYGYGRAHIPLQSGSHKFNISLLTPVPSSLLGKFAMIFGYQPELLQPTMLATTAGNNWNCTDCVSSASVYEALGCPILCRQGVCVTTYTCVRPIIRYGAVMGKCYIQGFYYNLGTILPNKYPSPNGKNLCNYVCSRVNNYYYFTPTNCEAINYLPAPNLCQTTVQLYGPQILYYYNAIVYKPSVCQIVIIPVSSTVPPPSNCSGPKCCKFGDKRYSKGTVIDFGLGFLCTCKCPPLLFCG